MSTLPAFYRPHPHVQSNLHWFYFKHVSHVTRDVSKNSNGFWVRVKICWWSLFRDLEYFGYKFRGEIVMLSKWDCHLCCQRSYGHTFCLSSVQGFADPNWCAVKAVPLLPLLFAVEPGLITLLQAIFTRSQMSCHCQYTAGANVESWQLQFRSVSGLTVCEDWKCNLSTMLWSNLSLPHIFELRAFLVRPTSVCPWTWICLQSLKPRDICGVPHLEVGSSCDKCTVPSCLCHCCNPSNILGVVSGKNRI